MAHQPVRVAASSGKRTEYAVFNRRGGAGRATDCRGQRSHPDRKSTRLNSSHLGISYAVFCLKKHNKRKVEAGVLAAQIDVAWQVAQTQRQLLFFSDTQTPDIYTLPQHDPLPT